MIWQEKAYCIVMATNVFEHARVSREMKTPCLLDDSTCENLRFGLRLERYVHEMGGNLY